MRTDTFSRARTQALRLIPLVLGTWAILASGTARAQVAALFDGTTLTVTTNFLFLLDNWQMIAPELGSPPIGLTDFLALLDNCRLGPNCT